MELLEDTDCAEVTLTSHGPSVSRRLLEAMLAEY